MYDLTGAWYESEQRPDLKQVFAQDVDQAAFLLALGRQLGADEESGVPHGEDLNIGVVAVVIRHGSYAANCLALSLIITLAKVLCNHCRHITA